MGPQWCKSQEPPVLIILPVPWAFSREPGPRVLVSLTQKSLEIEPEHPPSWGTLGETEGLYPKPVRGISTTRNLEARPLFCLISSHSLIQATWNVLSEFCV